MDRAVCDLVGQLHSKWKTGYNALATPRSSQPYEERVPRALVKPLAADLGCRHQYAKLAWVAARVKLPLSLQQSHECGTTQWQGPLWAQLCSG